MKTYQPFSIYGNNRFFFSVHFRIQTILALPIIQRAAASLCLHRVSSTFSNSRGRCIAAMYIVSIVQRIPGWLEAGKRWGGIWSKCHNVLWKLNVLKKSARWETKKLCWGKICSIYLKRIYLYLFSMDLVYSKKIYIKS